MKLCYLGLLNDKKLWKPDYMSLTMLATCPKDGISILINELEDLGARNISAQYMAVEFQVDEELYYKAHLKLSTASQIFLILRKCSAKDKATLLSQAKRIKWETIFDLNYSYRVDGIAGNRGDDKMTANEISKQVRLAIQDVFKYRKKETPRVELKDPDIVVSTLVRDGRACISICTSGWPLNKRGYRINSNHPAPIKETLAAALLKHCDYNGSQTLLDPMCGSGTIAIEAAMLALNKSSLIDRKTEDFGFSRLKSFNKNLWNKVRKDLQNKTLSNLEHKIFASDKDANYVNMAKDCALSAKVSKFINFSEASFFELEKPTPTGIIVTNLPYGERLKSEDEMKIFYKEIGDTLKKNWSGWKVCLFVSEESHWKGFRLKPSKKTPFLNGALKTRLLIFEMYSGSKR